MVCWAGAGERGKGGRRMGKGGVVLRMGLAAVAATVVSAGASAQTPAAPAAPAAPPDSVVFVGAGDIAKCDILGGAVGTALLLDRIPGTVYTVGDNAYDEGSVKNFKDCYGPTWGRHKARTRPAPGNHDYGTGSLKPYFDFFGENAGPPGLGYYSYDLGAWHIISLASFIAIDSRSPQYKWLQQDLEAHPSDCTLAYWHAPMFSSGPHGNEPRLRDVWRLLYEHGVDVVLNGHDHDYERFAPLDPDGRPDPSRGIREFIVGTGGGGVYKLKRKQPGSEVFDNSSYGVLKLTLSPGSYTWEFVPIPGHHFTDSGSGTCSPQR